MKHYIHFWDCTAADFPPEKWETTKETQSSQDYLLNLKWVWLNWNKAHQCSNTQGSVFHGGVVSALNGPVAFCEQILFVPGLLIAHLWQVLHSPVNNTGTQGFSYLQRQERRWQLKNSLFKIQKEKQTNINHWTFLIQCLTHPPMQLNYPQDSKVLHST